MTLDEIMACTDPEALRAFVAARGYDAECGPWVLDPDATEVTLAPRGGRLAAARTVAGSRLLAWKSAAFLALVGV